MKTACRALLAVVAAATLSGCYVNLATPTPNLAVTLDADSSPRKGTSTCSGFLWVFATGDCSVETAMRTGRITKVHHVDARTRILLYGLTSELTITVHGE